MSRTAAEGRTRPDPGNMSRSERRALYSVLEDSTAANNARRRWNEILIKELRKARKSAYEADHEKATAESALRTAKADIETLERRLSIQTNSLQTDLVRERALVASQVELLAVQKKRIEMHDAALERSGIALIQLLCIQDRLTTQPPAPAPVPTGAPSSRASPAWVDQDPRFRHACRTDGHAREADHATPAAPPATPATSDTLEEALEEIEDDDDFYIDLESAVDHSRCVSGCTHGY